MEGAAGNMYPRACAACKHQRKRCDANCQLARYFPPNKVEEFESVHGLFGVNNVVKLLNSVADHEKDISVESLIVEAKIRRENPVHGALGVQRQLEMEIDACQKELDLVQKQLKFCKEVEKLQQQKVQPEAQLDKPSLATLFPTLEQILGASAPGIESTTSTAEFGEGSVPQMI